MDYVTEYDIAVLRRTWDRPSPLCRCRSREAAVAIVESLLRADDEDLAQIIIQPALRPKSLS